MMKMKLKLHWLLQRLMLTLLQRLTKRRKEKEDNMLMRTKLLHRLPKRRKKRKAKRINHLHLHLLQLKKLRRKERNQNRKKRHLILMTLVVLEVTLKRTQQARVCRITLKTKIAIMKLIKEHHKLHHLKMSMNSRWEKIGRRTTNIKRKRI